MREKRRYLLVEASEAVAHAHDFEHALSVQILRCVGELGYHTISPKIVKVASPTLFVIRTRARGLRTLVLALALIKRLDGRHVAFYTLKTSGLPSHIEAAAQRMMSECAAGQ